MPVEPTSIAGLWIVRQPTHRDERGFFRQTYVLDELSESIGHEPRFVQGNHARSEAGVLRGFHAEPWDKFVYVPRGSVLAVVADIRPDSATFGRHVTIELGDAAPDHVRLFVSEGLANAYCVTGDGPADYVYDVTAVWRPGVERVTVRWDDETLGVDWPLAEPRLSPHDRAAPTLREQHEDHPIFR